MNVGKNVFVGETSFPHKFRRLWRYVEILLSARFLLSENDSGKLALFVDVAPSQTENGTPPETCQTGKQERSFDLRVFALRRCEFPNLVECQVHTSSLLGLEPLDTSERIRRDNSLLVSLIQTGSQFIKVRQFRVSGEGLVFDSFPVIVSPSDGVVFEIVFETQNPFGRDFFESYALPLFVLFQMMQTGIPISPITSALLSETLFAEFPVIIEKSEFSRRLGLEPELPVPEFDYSFRPDSVGEFERLFVLLSVGSRLFGNQVHFQILVCPFSVEIDVEVQGNVPRRHFTLSEAYRFF